MCDTVCTDYLPNNWMMALLVIAMSILVCKALAMLNRRLIKKIADARHQPYEGICLKAIQPPILTSIMLLSVWIALQRLSPASNIRAGINHAYSILFILGVTWFVACLITSLVEENILMHQRRKTSHLFDTKLLPLIKRCLHIAIWLIGIVMALNNAGVQVSTLLGTLGVGGIAFALAAQDTIKNIFGGITIFVDRTFKIGDIIRFDGLEGIVEDIGIRSARIRTYDRQIVVIPNYKLTDALITNVSREHARRVTTTLGLTYDTDYHAMKRALELLKTIPQTLPDVHAKDLSATFSEFGQSALVITFIYFICKQADVRETVSAVNFEILRLYTEAGLHFAFPTQTVLLESNTKP